MEIFPVYNRFAIEPVQGKGPYLWDDKGNKYLDFYGGHAVISVGHAHPKFVQDIQHQAGNLGYYSNAVPNRLQNNLAEKLGSLSGYTDYQLFLCNSGAEANENALKLASFQNDRKKIIAFKGGFHGRTSAAVNVTDNPDIQAPINRNLDVRILPLNDYDALIQALSNDVSAVIIEGIQGIGGVHIPEPEFLQLIRKLCNETGVFLILDEIQSGYGRSGRFFAHQASGIRPDLITVAKGMGNGFPIAGVLISPEFQAQPGMLGSTFGGNHLACTAGNAVLDIIEAENLMKNSDEIGHYLLNKIKAMRPSVTDVRGLGLMIGIELPFQAGEIRKKLLHEHHIFTGSSAEKNTLRILPPLSITRAHADQFLQALTITLSDYE